METLAVAQAKFMGWAVGRWASAPPIKVLSLYLSSRQYDVINFITQALQNFNFIQLAICGSLDF